MRWLQAEALCQHYCRGLQQVLEAQCQALRTHSGAPEDLLRVARGLWLQALRSSRVGSRDWPRAVWAGEKGREGATVRQARARSSVRHFARQPAPVQPLSGEHSADEGAAGGGRQGGEGEAEGALEISEAEEEMEEVRGVGPGAEDGVDEDVEEAGAPGEEVAGLQEGAEGPSHGAQGLQEGVKGSEPAPSAEDAVVSPGAMACPGVVEHVGCDERATVSDEWKGMMRELGRGRSPLMLIRHQLRRHGPQLPHCTPPPPGPQSRGAALAGLWKQWA